MRKHFKILAMLLVLVSSLLAGCESITVDQSKSKGAEKRDLSITFFDVGQADSTLIQFPNGKTALVDGGNREDADFLVKSISELGIEKLDYLIATHPHEDHIGGLPKIIERFEIGEVYMPDATATTRIFETLLNTISEKGLEINAVQGKVDILSEDGLKFYTLAPNSESYESLNDYSVVSKVVYGDFSAIITGDSQKTSEREMIESGEDLSATLLKVSHHGSTTSNTDDFLEAVNPEYGIISVGADNSYGHPHKEILERLEEHQIEVMRTDELGTIKVVSDGSGVKFYSNGEI